MPTHSPAPSDAVALIAERINSGHYPDLVEAGVTIKALFAYSIDDKPAVKSQGYPATHEIRPNNEKQRLQGMADATLTLDGRAWADRWSDDEKAAEIDHALERLVVARSRPTKQSPVAYILSDDAGRPRLRIRKHDYRIGYFVAIARRHGEAAPEVRAAREFIRENEHELFRTEAERKAAGVAGPRLAAV